MRPLRIKVLIGPSTFGEHDPAPLVHLAEAGCDIIENPYKRRLTRDEVLKLLSDKVTGLIAGLEPLGRDVLEKTRLRVISRCGVGTSNIDLEAARELCIKVRSTPDAPTTSVAELTIGAMINTLRQISRMDMDLHGGRWAKQIGVQLEGKAVAIIGLGRIGRKVASLLKGFNVKLIAVDPNLSGKVDGVEICSLEEALPKADIVTIHSGGESQIMGSNEFKLIKDGAFLLNAARGGVVDETALIEALDNGKIKGAWIDTFNIEPYTGPLKSYSQVILTPHAGSYTVECRKIMETEAVNNLISAFREGSDDA